MINVFHGRTQVVRILRVPLRTLIIDHPQWHWGCVDQLMLSHSYNYTYTQLYTHKVS